MKTLNHIFVNTLGTSLFKLLSLLFCVSGLYVLVLANSGALSEIWLNKAKELGIYLFKNQAYKPPMEPAVNSKLLSRSEGNKLSRAKTVSYNAAGRFKQIGEQHLLEISKGTVFHGEGLEKYVKVYDPLAKINSHFFQKQGSNSNEYEFSDHHSIVFTSDNTFRMLIRGAYVEYQRVNSTEAQKAEPARSNDQLGGEEGKQKTKA